MDYRFSDAIANTPKSFIREILKLTQSDNIISFAGGLPNSALFPVDAIRHAAERVLSRDGRNTLQYSTTEGHAPLRAWIAERYARHGMKVAPEQVLITNGSQQALDLLGKVFLNPGDAVALENPSYLGAIQAFRLFRPQFHSATLSADGIDVAELQAVMGQHQCRFFYGIPNFQNPTGLSYSAATRQQLATMLQQEQQLMIEDDPYGALRFSGSSLPPVAALAPEQVVMLGSFSKVCAPGMRLGWMVAPVPVVAQLAVAKQAADLHSGYFSQRVLYQYLQDNDLDEHISQISHAYQQQQQAMVAALQQHLPPGIAHTTPEGGMFLWLTLPEHWSATDLFHIAVRHGVAFVPGEPFFADASQRHHLRMSYCTVDAATIHTGVQRLAAAMAEYAAQLPQHSKETQ